MSSADQPKWMRTDGARAIPANPADIHKTISHVCPIDGLSIGKWDDKSTWRIDYSAKASVGQRILAQQAITKIRIEDLRAGRQPARKIF